MLGLRGLTETDFSKATHERNIEAGAAMAKIGRPIKFVIRLTPEERARLDGMIHCGKGSVNSALKARILQS